MYCLQYSDPFPSDLFMATNNLPYYSLENALNNLFLDSQSIWILCFWIINIVY